MVCTGHYVRATCAGHTVGDCVAHNAAACPGHVTTACHSHVTTACTTHNADHACTAHATTACASHVGVVSGGEASIWTDPVLSTNVKIKSIHHNELKTAIDAELARRGLPFFTTGLVSQAYKAHGGHVQVLRDELKKAADQEGPWTPPDELSDENLGTDDKVKTTQFTALRSKTNSLETNCACNCDYACTCQCNYACTCNCNYACTCQCNYACTCLCNYACTCQCNYTCTCNCNYACTCQCNYVCTCNCNYACTCNCAYACTCNCNYACTCNCNYLCTCDCAYTSPIFSDERLKNNITYM